MTKPEARKLAKACRAAVDLHTVGHAMAGVLFTLPAWQHADTVLAFASMPDEPDTADILRQALAEKFSGGAPCDGSILTNPRQAGAVRCAHAALERALAGLQAQMTPDAVLLDVEAAMQAIGELTGKTIREDITQRIFSRFCVGK